MTRSCAHFQYIDVRFQPIYGGACHRVEFRALHLKKPAYLGQQALQSYPSSLVYVWTYRLLALQYLNEDNYIFSLAY